MTAPPPSNDASRAASGGSATPSGAGGGGTAGAHAEGAGGRAATPASGSVKRVSSNPTARPPGPRPTGQRPPGARPSGPRPDAVQPSRTRPPGARPAGPRPAGPRPAGSRPAGPRPAGPRPRGSRPSGPRPPGSRPPGQAGPAGNGRGAGAATADRIAERPPPAPLGESSWTAFFRPVKSPRPGTMPAGMVLVVAVAALVLAMFLSADAIHRKAEGRPNQAEWRKTMSQAVVNISDTFKVDAPAKTVDDAVGPLIGHERKTGQQTTDEILAAKRAAEGDDPTATTAPASTVPGETVAPGASQPAPPTTVDRTPKLRAPTVDNPLKVWVGGDSISYDPGVAMSNFSSKTKLMAVTQDSRASTGLVRSDFFNWPEHLYRDVVPTNPDVMMIMYGGNDAQGIAAGAGVAYAYGSPEWQAEYRKRVGDTMDLLKSKNNDRLIIWMGMPPVAPTSSIKNMDMMNYIFFTEAQKRPWVKYFDSWPFFTGTDGGYALSLPSADGSVHVMRAKDGVHFSQTGGERFGWAVYAKLSGFVDFSAAPPLAPDPTSAPPPDIKERPDVPPAPNQAG